MTVTAINARRTVNRNTNMRRLVEEIGKRDMTRADIEELLDLSAGGARYYLKDLSALTKVIRPRHRSMPNQYRLTSDAERVAAFIAALTAPKEPEEPKPRVRSRTMAALALRDSSRHFHILADDEFHAVKIPRASVMPDPWALPVEFFRSVGAGVRP